MAKYVMKRFFQSILTLFIVVTIVFCLMRLFPEEGYFQENYEKLTQEQRDNILASMGLKDPIVVQLKNFYVNLFKGDLGKSIVYRPKYPITKILVPKMMMSFKFGAFALAFSLLVGFSLGILMARMKGTPVDGLGTAYIVVLMAVPGAVIYITIQTFITKWFHLPMLYDPDNFKSWIVPAISMSLGSIASYAMWIRRYMVDEVNKDYVKLARAKGLKEGPIMVRHVLRNAFIPMAQYLPTSILMTISGSIYIESLFTIPGMGGLLVDAIQRQDNNLVQVLVLLFSSIGIFGLFLGDILMAVVDPRIKLSAKAGAR